MPNYQPIEVAIALSLYGYNVAPALRAKQLYDHFGGACMELNDLTKLMCNGGEFLATELPYPSAEIYVSHALAKYGHEAIERVRVNANVKI